MASCFASNEVSALAAIAASDDDAVGMRDVVVLAEATVVWTAACVDAAVTWTAACEARGRAWPRRAL
jgi:hypothetical protein